MTQTLRSKLSLAVAVLAGIPLAACGGSAPAAVETGEKVVFVTTQDCASTKKLKADECAAVVKTALDDHLAQAPTYRSMVSCEKVEGETRCERMDEKTFRPRLLAMSVIVGDAEAARAKMLPIPVTPLYATLAGEAGFRTLNKTILKGDDDLIQFTPKAIAAYSAFVARS